jgi:hypothetical protein
MIRILFSFFCHRKRFVAEPKTQKSTAAARTPRARRFSELANPA